MELVKFCFQGGSPGVKYEIKNGRICFITSLSFELKARKNQIYERAQASSFLSLSVSLLSIPAIISIRGTE
jgi:hypothetical protein